MRSALILSLIFLVVAACGRRNEVGQAGKRAGEVVKIAPVSSGAQGTASWGGSMPPPTEFDVPRDGRGRYAMHSTVQGIYFTAIDRLPHVVQIPRQGNGCASNDMPLTSDAASAARQAGWLVVAEAAVGGLSVVSLARGIRDDIGPVCNEIDGVVILFDGTRPIGLLRRYDEHETGLGDLQRLENGALRMGIIAMSSPIGDLVVERKSISFRPIPPLDNYCGHLVSVPNIFRMDVRHMRRAVIEAGWRPIAVNVTNHENPGYYAYQRAGMREAEECGEAHESGCTFDYMRRGAVLKVTAASHDHAVETPMDYDNRPFEGHMPTIEESIYFLDETIVDYSVACPKRRERVVR